jgi:hypothetical protein
MNKLRDFRGLQWGCDFQSINDLIIYSQVMNGRLKYCFRANDEKVIGGTTVESIAYSFFDDKFYEAQIITHSWAHALALLEYLVPTLGKYEFYEEELHKLYVWDDDEIEVWCAYNKPSDSVELVYIYKPIKAMLAKAEGVPLEEILNRKDVIMLNIVAQKSGISTEQLVQNIAEPHDEAKAQKEQAPVFVTEKRTSAKFPWWGWLILFFVLSALLKVCGHG